MFRPTPPRLRLPASRRRRVLASTIASGLALAAGAAVFSLSDADRAPAAANDEAVASVAVPVRGAQGVIGAVLIEQTTNAILSIQNLALQRLFAVTLIFFVVTSLGLLAFASLLTSRIRRLRDRLDNAVSHDGRIIGEVRPGRSPDSAGPCRT